MELTDKNKPFDFWNDHSLEFLEMAMKRDYQERVESCDGYGKSVRKDCRDTIEFFVMVSSDRLTAISYDLKGCLFSHACANTLIELAKGKTLAEAAKITRQEIVDYLKTLPVNEMHCADHALAAFGQALADLEK
jgi:nitrogen fixation NifU-like protein